MPLRYYYDGGIPDARPVDQSAVPNAISGPLFNSEPVNVNEFLQPAPAAPLNIPAELGSGAGPAGIPNAPLPQDLLDVIGQPRASVQPSLDQVAGIGVSAAADTAQANLNQIEAARLNDQRTLNEEQARNQLFDAVIARADFGANAIPEPERRGLELFDDPRLSLTQRLDPEQFLINERGIGPDRESQSLLRDYIDTRREQGVASADALRQFRDFSLSRARERVEDNAQTLEQQELQELAAGRTAEIAEELTEVTGIIGALDLKTEQARQSEAQGLDEDAAAASAVRLGVLRVGFGNQSLDAFMREFRQRQGQSAITTRRGAFGGAGSGPQTDSGATPFYVFRGTDDPITFSTVGRATGDGGVITSESNTFDAIEAEIRAILGMAEGNNQFDSAQFQRRVAMSNEALEKFQEYFARERDNYELGGFGK